MSEFQKVFDIMKEPDSPKSAKKTPPRRFQVPKTPLALRIGAIMHRKSDTPWDVVKEVTVYLQILPHIKLDALANLERRYKTLWPPNRTKNSLRHDLLTLLNNWFTECERANAWAMANPERRTRKIIPITLERTVEHVEQADPEQLERFNKERERRKAERG